MINLRVSCLLILAVVGPSSSHSIGGEMKPRVNCRVDSHSYQLICDLSASDFDLKRNTKQWRQSHDQGYIGNLPEVNEYRTQFRMTMYKFDNNTFISCQIGKSNSDFYKIAFSNILTYERYPVNHTIHYSNKPITYNCNPNPYTVVGWIIPTKPIETFKKQFHMTLTNMQTNSILCCISYKSTKVYVTTIQRYVDNCTELIYKEPGKDTPSTITQAMPKITSTQATKPATSATTTTQPATKARTLATTTTQVAPKAKTSATTTTQATTKAKTLPTTTTQLATKAKTSATTTTQVAPKAKTSATTTTQAATKTKTSATTTTKLATTPITPATTKPQAATTVPTSDKPTTHTATMPTTSKMATYIDSLKYYIIIVAVVGTIILISLIYVIIKKFCRKSSEAEGTLEVATYASAGNVLYADLNMPPNSKELPPATDESPYAEIVGILTPNNK